MVDPAAAAERFAEDEGGPLYTFEDARLLSRHLRGVTRG